MRPDPEVVREIVRNQRRAAMMYEDSLQLLTDDKVKAYSQKVRAYLLANAIECQHEAAVHAFMARTALIAIINGESDADA